MTAIKLHTYLMKYIGINLTKLILIVIRIGKKSNTIYQKKLKIDFIL